VSDVEVALRAATPCDAAAISSLLGELGHPAAPADVAKRLAAYAAVRSHKVVLAEIGTTVVGVLETHAIPFVFHEAPTLRVATLVVASGARRLGVGRALIAAAEQEAARIGAKVIELTTAAHRADAHAFYRALGYETPTALRFVKKLG
jgi:GNAT superfamily N-acetyltransferase